MVEMDARGHERSCDEYGQQVPFGDPESTHVDFYCDCHRFTHPMVLENGTDIAWPAGWKEE